MIDTVRNWVRVILALVSGLLFVIVYVWAIVLVWVGCPNPSKFPFTPPAIYVGTSLSALVGGVVAAAFGQAAPKLPARLAGLADYIVPVHAISDRWRNTISVFYIAIYLGVGLASLVTWMFESSCVPGLIKDLAVIWIGFCIAIVHSVAKPASE